MKPIKLFYKIYKKTLAEYKMYSYNDVRLSVQVKIIEGGMISYV